ncbi:hypothetical protein ACFW04_014341 [Cataglyphis niger]
MFIAILLLSMFILLLYYYYVHYGRNGRLLNLVPGPPSHPIVGNAFLFNASVGKYKSTKWHARRKILTPAFHFNILKQFTDILIKEGDYMAESLKDVGGTVVKDLIPFITEHTLNAICVKKKRLAMLDLLIAVSRDNLLSDSDIREEVDTFMFEGHDTTAMGISFALLLLAEHKDIQERVRIEVENAMQESGGKLTIRSLQNLPYLERCLKEALRLYPSVFFVIRNIEEDVKLHSHVIPAGTMLFLNIYGVHRDPNFWSNPKVFDPDRFLPERIQKRHPYFYLPFSAGPRNCIGQRFGLLELKAMIAPLIHNFYLEPIDHLKDIRLKADIIIRPSQPVHIKFIPIIRKKSFRTNIGTI